MRLRVLGLSLLLLSASSCSKKQHNPTAPPGAVQGTLVITSFPQTASIVINGAPTGRFTPTRLDTASSTYSIRLSMLGYADTTVTVALAASGSDTVKANLRALPTTPAWFTTWPVNHPQSVGTDAVGNVYVANRDSLFVFSRDGLLLRAWLMHDDPDHVYSGVVVDSHGAVFVAQSSTFVRKYSSTGTFLLNLSYYGNGGMFPFGIDAIAIDASDHVYVAIRQYGPSMQLFSAGGAYLSDNPCLPVDFGPVGVLAHGSADVLYAARVEGASSAVTTRLYALPCVSGTVQSWERPRGAGSLAVADNGDVFVDAGPVDADGPRTIQRLSPAGVLLAEWAVERYGLNSGGPIAAGPSGILVSVDYNYNRVLRWAWQEGAPPKD
jgi:PEGA domain